MKYSLVFMMYSVDSQVPETDCDYVKLNVADNATGNYSGYYGIRKGHAKAVFSLAEGTVSVYKDKKVILSASCSEGFAVVENNTVSVTVDSFKEI